MARKPKPDCRYCDRGRPVIARNMCRSCYYRFMTYGSVNLGKTIRKQRPPCKSPGCSTLAQAHDYCGAHNARATRHDGEVFAEIPIGSVRKLPKPVGESNDSV
jgi:hypothetical protein